MKISILLLLIISSLFSHQTEEIPFWVKKDIYYKFYGIGQANKHLKGRHYQENLARSRARKDLQKRYDKKHLSNTLMNRYNKLLETKSYIDTKGRVYILLYLDNYKLN